MKIGEAFIEVHADTANLAGEVQKGAAAAGDALGSGLQRGSTVATAATKNVSKAIGDVATASESSAKRASSAFKSVATTLSRGSGGAFGPLQEGFAAISEGLDKIGEHGKTTGAYLLGMGAAGVGAGALLLAAASGDQQAHQQLAAAILNTGSAIDDFDGKITKLDKSYEGLGYKTKDTEQALRVLVQSTGDTDKAIGEMGVAADLAAAKHEGLSEAATQLSLILGGKGARTLAQFGINLKDFKGDVNAGEEAVAALAAKIDGQAAASIDTFSGRMKVIGARVEDFVAQVGEKFGPAILGISTGITALGGVLEIGGGIIDHFTKAEEAATVGAEGLATAEGEAEAAGIGLGTGLGAAAIALGALYIILRSQGTIVDENTALTKKYTDAVGHMKDGVHAAFDEMASGALSTEKAVSTLETLGLTQQQVTTAMNGTKGELKDLYDALGKTTEGNKKASDAFQALRFTVGDIQWGQETAGATEYNLAISKLGANAFQELLNYSGASDDAIKTVNAAFANGTITAGELNLSSDDLAKTMGILQKAMDAQAAAAKGADSAESGLKSKVSTLSEQMSAAGKDADFFKRSLDLLTGGAISAAKATDSYYASVDDLTKNIKRGKDALNEQTDVGRTNREEIAKSVSAIFDLANAQVHQGVSTEQVSSDTKAHIETLKEQLVHLGLNKDKVDAYVTSLGATPENVDTAIRMSGQDKAKADIEDHLKQLDGVPKTKQTEIQALIDRGALSTAQLELDKLTEPRSIRVQLETNIASIISSLGPFASVLGFKSKKYGGPIDGPPDQPVPIIAHGGEYVLTKEVVDDIKQGRPPRDVAQMSSMSLVGSTPPPVQAAVGGDGATLYAPLTINGDVDKATAEELLRQWQQTVLDTYAAGRRR